MTIRAGAAGTSGWTARWTLAGGQTVNQVWNGVPTFNGSSVSVRNASWNGALAPNGTTKFGFLAGGTPSAATLTSP